MIYFECIGAKENRVQFTLQRIDEWVNSVALSNILKSFGASMPPNMNISESVDWLLKFSDEWDYRKKQQSAKDIKTNEAARWLINDNEITTEQAHAVMNGIAELGLAGVDVPLRRDYDYVVALGGARLSSLLRPQYAHKVISKFSINPRAVIMLSAFRPIADSERETTDTYAKGAKTEFDLICRGAEQCFGVSKYHEERHDDSNINSSWAIRTYENEMPIISISGPSTEPSIRRANSADTYKFFIQKHNVEKGSKLLLITSQIYVPYQQLEAIRTLAIPHDIVVETIGFPRDESRQIKGMQQPSNYLQEIRSTIQAMGRLISDINW